MNIMYTCFSIFFLNFSFNSINKTFHVHFFHSVILIIKKWFIGSIFFIISTFYNIFLLFIVWFTRLEVLQSHFHYGSKIFFLCTEKLSLSFYFQEMLTQRFSFLLFEKREKLRSLNRLLKKITLITFCLFKLY